MAEKAKFETYTFSPDPPWTAQAQITELDFLVNTLLSLPIERTMADMLFLRRTLLTKRNLSRKSKDRGRLYIPHQIISNSGEEKEIEKSGFLRFS